MTLLEHDVETCIGCGACEAVHPDGWKMDDDGKCKIQGGKKRADGWEEKELTDPEDIKKHREALESCPVSCIHLPDE